MKKDMGYGKNRKGEIMKRDFFKIFKIIGCVILIPILGYISSLFFEARSLYTNLNTPPLSPPGWLFGIAWSFLYSLLGVTLYYLIKNKNKNGLKIFIIQLIINFMWSYIFFNYELFIVALVVIGVIILLTALLFYLIGEHKYKYLLIPYLLWLTFAFYLNLGIIVLN